MAFSIDNPDALSDEEWAKKVNQYLFVKKLEYKNMKTVFTSALAEVLNKALGNE